MPITTDLLIGSYPSLPEQTLSVDGGSGYEPAVISAGSYYLFNDANGFDLLDALAAALNSLGDIDDAVVYLGRDLRVRIDSETPTGSIAITWPTDGVLRDLLGFTGNLTGAAGFGTPAYVATNISPLVWSAGRTATYEARLGTDGIMVHDTAVGSSATGIVRATRHNSYRRNTLTWRYIANSRVWTTAEAGGELYSFHENVLSLFRRFKIWREITEDSASATEITFGDVLPSTGAYVFSSPTVAMSWGREFGFTETVHPITIPVITSPEYLS